MLRAVATAGAALALATAAGCGTQPDALPDKNQDPRAAACAGTTTGAEALEADGTPPAERVDQSMAVATQAARALADDVEPTAPGERHAKAVHALQSQAARLRAVRDQLERGSKPGVVLAAARASLEDGDLQARRRLADAGLDCPP
jgi:hypothetical protein